MNRLVCSSWKVRSPNYSPALLYREFVMSIFLSVLCIWLALNVVIVAALYFKPLRAARRRRRLREYDALAFSRHRRWRSHFGSLRTLLAPYAAKRPENRGIKEGATIR